ncbi:formyltransferase family protein [Kitasatospora sp. LaBMicrA B282]|uniref:formyltransferase family protein n=1 Tax=Kitasatospora sp. LaBMicrA B282 TaxID=3420949 RepID=UPI003D0F53B9
MPTPTHTQPDDAARRMAIPGCTAPAELRFAYLNLKDHPRGVLMLQLLLAAGYRPALVIDEESTLAEQGRTAQLTELTKVAGFRPAPSTAALCAEYGIRHVTVADHNAPEVGQLLREAGADVGVLGDTRILRDHVIASAPHGIINVHPGFLPEVRGNHPYIWSVIHNLPQGATAHLIDAGVDRGPILVSRRLEPAPGTGLPQLIHRLNELCGEVLVEALNEIVAGRAVATPQPDDRRLTFREAHPEIRRLAGELLLNRAA